MWCVYIIEKSGKYYTGITTDLVNRLNQHKVKEVLYNQIFPEKYSAALLERRIKTWSRNKKETLIAKFSK